jgi:hypothetical protein
MPMASSKKKKRGPEDSVQAAARSMRAFAERTERDAEPEVEITPEMRAAAAAFGRIGGLKGGPARAASMTAKKRSEIAKKAAVARWKRRGE